MKIMTILGTRPEIIRLSLIIGKLDKLCEHVLVHTGQNYDVNLKDIFFQHLGVRQPNHFLGVKGETFGEQIGKILIESEKVLRSDKPDRLLVLGDTNSCLAAIVAKRMSIPVYHMEAGNRCYDDRVPEEVNRRLIDHSSDILMPYTERSRANLLREGIEANRICVIGNPIFEVIQHYGPAVSRSNILRQLRLKPEKYFLVTMHRAENVDVEARLRSLTQALSLLQKEYKMPIICSLHPRTKNRMQRFGVDVKSKQIIFHDPFGFFDFITLEQNASCVLSDSGTVQEECCIFRVANVTIRDVTERPETIECGSNMLSGADPEMILQCVRVVLAQNCSWSVPSEYLMRHVSNTVVKIVLGHARNPRAAGRPLSPGR
jgi:UDP-N-acetylglucosamine 2-epimerase (non-hydrolysing)